MLDFFGTICSFLSLKNSLVQATPRSGTILINVGDLLEIYSNGLFPATLHRVVIPGLLHIKISVCKLKYHGRYENIYLLISFKADFLLDFLDEAIK